MSSLRHPVGPQPPSVYWRRRAIVGLGLIAVIVVIVLIVVRPGTAENAGSGNPAPAASDGAEAPAEEQSDLDAAAEEAGTGGVAGAPQGCTADQVLITPVTDAESYSAEAQPQLSFTLLNTGAAACTMEAGSDVQEFLITSGPDRVWSSRDCQVDAVAASVVLEPGQERSTTPIPWNRTRSEPGVCDVQRTPVTAGGATYRLSVTVGEFASDGDRPFLLN